jgi:hypothetical protein
MFGISYNNNFMIHKKLNVGIIWQAKAACTVVNKMFFEKEKLLEKALEYSKWIHDYREQYIPQNHAYFNSCLHDPKIKFVQFVVNPYNRAVSSYIHMMRNNYSKKDSFTNMTFDEYLNIIYNGKLLPNPHHNKQTFFISKNIEFLRMEEVEKRLPEINTKYGLNYNHNHTSGHYAKRTSDESKFLGYTKWEDFKQNIPKNYSNFYNPEIRKKVEILYGEDIQNFGYTWEMFIKSNYLEKYNPKKKKFYTPKII